MFLMFRISFFVVFFYLEQVLSSTPKNILFLKSQPEKMLMVENGDITLDTGELPLSKNKNALFKVINTTTGKKIVFGQKYLCISRNYENIRLCDHKKEKKSFSIWNFDMNDKKKNLRLRIDDHCLLVHPDKNDIESENYFLTMRRCNPNSFIWKRKTANVDQHFQEENDFSDSNSESDNGTTLISDEEEFVDTNPGNNKREKSTVNIRCMSYLFPPNFSENKKLNLKSIYNKKYGENNELLRSIF